VTINNNKTINHQVPSKEPPGTIKEAQVPSKEAGTIKRTTRYHQRSRYHQKEAQGTIKEAGTIKRSTRYHQRSRYHQKKHQLPSVTITTISPCH
jgi:hypothetical protein